MERRARHFPASITMDQDKTLENAAESGPLRCLLVRKFTKTVEELSPEEKLKAMFEILRGLVAIDGTFVINDLHNGNMAIMPDGHAVTFDYDRACSSEEFPKYLEEIRRNPGPYEGFSQYKHILESEEKDDVTLTKISDILAVLASVDDTVGMSRHHGAINTCRAAVWAAKADKKARGQAIDTLRSVVLPVKGGGTRRRKRLPRLY